MDRTSVTSLRSTHLRRHCERSEAIHISTSGAMDCFAALAMTGLLLIQTSNSSPLSSSGSTGRSSIPETAVLTLKRRGLLDAPHFAGHGGGVRM
jgi:hypothetical protein